MNEKQKLEAFLQNYLKWFDFLHSKVDFNYKDSLLHTLGHCSRVLFFALLISEMMNLKKEDKDALAQAACFHDSRRIDDTLDTGHGRRAAEYYRDFCQKNALDYDERVYYAISYHDQDDELGEKVISRKFPEDSSALTIYKIFKDADALDRFRLGPDGLDERFLRTDKARELVPFAKMLYKLDLDEYFN